MLDYRGPVRGSYDDFTVPKRALTAYAIFVKKVGASDLSEGRSFSNRLTIWSRLRSWAFLAKSGPG